MNYKHEFIEFMVRSGVLTFGDFTTKSGRKTPYFVNTGNYQTAMQAAKLGEYYAEMIMKDGIEDIDLLFGPAYKGIPLVVATAIALYNKHGVDIPYCFNRKEAKDHGEGGVVVGRKPKDGDRIAIIEDVTTAGTSIRESFELLTPMADISIDKLFVSIDRMECGSTEKTALNEISEKYGLAANAIVNVEDVREYLLNREIDGEVVLDDVIYGMMTDYLAKYGGK